MKIRLFNFRKWENICFDLNDDITKITGESGAGKSTIFEAIYWCLYGKTKSVSTKGKTGKTEVVIEMDIFDQNEEKKLTIHRSGLKNISVILGKEEMTGDIAQDKIHQLFGTAELFLLTSYLRPESTHPLISSTPTEKREYTSLMFPDAAKYEVYKDRLSNIRKKDEQSLYQVKNQILSAKSSCDTISKTNPWILSNQDIIPESEGSIDTLQKEVQVLQNKKNDITTTKAVLESVNNQLQSLPESRETDTLDEQIKILREKLMMSIVSGRTKESALQSLQVQIDGKKQVLVSNLIATTYSQLDQKECERYISICDELLSIAISSNDIQDKISKISNDISEKSSLLYNYELSYDNIMYNMKLDEILECPHCSGKVTHTDKLHVYSGPVEPKEVVHSITSGDIQKLKLSIDKMEDEKQRLIKQYNRYQDILSKESPKKNSISLSSIDLSMFRNACKEYIQVKKQIDALEKEYNTILSENKEYISSDEKKEIETTISKLSKEITTILSIEKNRESLHEQVSKLEKKYENPDELLSTISADIDSKQKEIANIIEAKSRNKIIMIYKESMAILEKNQEECVRLEKRLQNMASLEVTLASAYNKYVNLKLKEIEYDICMLGKTFFDNTMNITLTPGKEYSSGILRPSFDLIIEYNGTLFEDIKALSTGERKRISIILMMVLSKYTNGKILLLDEAFTSVGMDTRGIIMNELSKLDIPIYITSHDELVGYTSELNLNK